MKTVFANTVLDKARDKAKSGYPTEVFDILSREARVDYDAKVELLALAYHRNALRDSWHGRRFKDKRLKKKAKRMFRFAADLRDGNVMFSLHPEEGKGAAMLAPFLKLGEEHITNVLAHSDSYESGTAMIYDLQRTGRWESVRWLDVAFASNGKLLPNSCAIVGVRKKIY